MKKNTATLWNNLWQDTSSQEEDQFILAREEKTVRWQRLLAIVKHTFTNLNGLRVIEIGSGLGTYSALLAKQGCEATVLDYAPLALKRAQAFYDHNHLSVHTLECDALKLPSSLKGKFDITLSVGLAEHFLDSDRLLINKAHVDLLKAGGITFICVPYKYNPPYRLHKFAFEKLGLWQWGEEYPYSRKELFAIGKEIGLNNVQIFGESFMYSLNFINPFVLAKKILNIKPNYRKRSFRQEIGTPFDQFLSYSLILHGRK